MILVLACDSANGPPERVSLVGTWDLAITYGKPTAVCHLVNPFTTIDLDPDTGHPDLMGLSGGFDADSLICVSTIAGTGTTTPDPTGIYGSHYRKSVRLHVGINPLVITDLNLCGTLVTADSMAGGFCQPEAGDSMTATWSGRRQAAGAPQ